MADTDVGGAPPLRGGGASNRSELMSKDFRSRALASVAAVAIVASGAVGAALYEGQPAFAQTTSQITVNAQPPATFADLVDQVKPAVVSGPRKARNAVADRGRRPAELQ